MIKQLKCVSISLFFLILLLVGLNSCRDYGISWDEPVQRITGAVTVNYLAEKIQAPAFLASWKGKIPALDTYPDRDYGVAFEAPAVALEQLFGLKDSRDIYMFRHLLVFVLRPSPQTALLHALATAIAIDVRIMGILLPVVSVAILTARLIRHELPFRRTCLALGVYLLPAALW